MLLLTSIFFYFVFPCIVHQGIIEQSKSYEPETIFSFDNKYAMQTLKYEDETGIYASFIIELCDTGEQIFLCPDKYRTMDLKSITWADESYNIIVVSGDVGTINYCFVDN